jgi:RNA 3'-terminal phosphate cyclase-like protein
MNRVQFMRDILLFFGVKFKITPYTKGAPAPKTAEGSDEEEEDEEERNPTLQTVEGREGTGEVLMSCIGVGYSNVNKSMA